MKGSVHHNRWVCRKCREGDKNTILHPYHYVKVYLPYLRSEPFRLSGKEKGNPFENGIKAYNYLEGIQEAIKQEAFIPWSYRKQSDSLCNFENFFRKFKEHKYPNMEKHLEPLFGYDLKDIDRITLKKFYRTLPNNLKTSTKNLILQVIRATLSEAYQEGLVDFIPPMPKRDRAIKPVKNWLTWEDQMAVIRVLPERYKLIFLFLACHGKRIKETLSLRWENIDFKQKAFRLYQSKILTEQWLPIHEDFLKALPVIGAINKTGNVFHQHTRSYLNHILKKACKKAKIKPVSTHEFGRQSFVSQRLVAGLTNEQIALVTDNLGSIKNYAHMDIETKRKIINLKVVE